MSITWKHLKKTRTYERKGSYKEIVGDMQQIATIDRWLEQKYRPFLKFLVVSIAIGIVAFIVLAIPFLVFLFPPIFGIAVFSFIRIEYNSNLRLNKRRYQFTQKLLELINRDRHKNSPIQTYLSFYPVVCNNNQIQEYPHPYKSGWTFKIYEHEWLQLGGQFCDGTHFWLSVKDLFRQASGWKRSRSGKRKFKRKIKCKATEVFLCLKFSKKRYGAIQVLQAGTQNAIKLPENTICKNLKVKENTIKMKAKIHPENPTGVGNEIQFAGSKIVGVDEIYGTVVSMLLSSYQILNLARKLSKKR